jgi:CRISPR-associated protein Cas1
MIKKIIEISQARTHLAIQNKQLLIKSEDAKTASIPCEDVGVLIVDHIGTTYTHSVFSELLKNGAAIVLCGGNHHPAGMLLPVESNTLQSERFRQQIEAKEPVKKRLWRQIIRAKIQHQANLAGKGSDTYKALMALREEVRSGDPDNIEAQASKKFWAVYMPETDFRRDIGGTPPNNMLNYGYMVMRAAVARALCSAGLLPCIGIHHHNRYNAFCLADDVVEPFRGFVEAKVRDIYYEIGAVEQLNQEIKAKLLEVLYQEVAIAGFKGPLMVGLHRTAASLQRCFAEEQKELELPEL